VANEVNLDACAAVAFVAEGSTVRHYLRSVVSGKDLVMTRTALREFQGSLAAAAGPSEQARALRLLARLRIIPDGPSPRAQALRPTNNLEAEDIIILGTGDALGIATVTSDRRAVSAARSQRANIRVLLHPSEPLKGV